MAREFLSDHSAFARDRLFAPICAVAVFGAVVAGCGDDPDARVAQRASFQGLAELAPGLASYAKSVSADGATVVGYTYSADENRSVGFRWRRETGLVSLGTLPGRRSSQALDVSGDGSVVVGVSYEGVSDVAFRWTSSGGMVALPGLDQTGGVAVAISPDASVIVGYSNRQLVTWDRRGRVCGLGSMYEESMSRGYAISTDGRVVAGISMGNPEGGTEAFRWTSSTGFVGLGDLPGGTNQNRALAISGDGRVICGRSLLFDWARSVQGIPIACPIPTVPFCWSEETGMVRLPEFPYEPSWECDSRGGVVSLAAGMGINDDGSIVVGYVGDGFGNDVAVFWDEDGVHRIAERLDELGVDVGGWRLQHAEAVTPDGETIVGNGVSPEGVSAVWIAVVPRVQ